MKAFQLILIFFLLYGTCASIDIHQLLKNMTLVQKIGQMTQLDISMVLDYRTLMPDPNKVRIAAEYGVGSYINTPFSGGPINGIVGFNVSQWISFITELQKLVLQYNNPHQIPMIYGLDSVHGANYVIGAAIFPHNIGIAATFNPYIPYIEGAIAAKDTEVSGMPWMFSPVLGLGKQPLWPRFYETFGEDPHVGSVMGSQFVLGAQGSIPYNYNLAATAKHYLGYSDPKSGKDRTPAWIPDRMLYRYFVPSFKAAIDAGVKTIMINSGEINGIPVHASRQYLTDLLRNELNFTGVAVTDWQDIEKLNFYHHVAATPEDAVRIAIEAGVDMSMVPSDYSFPALLLQLVKANIISEERIDKSVLRILELKNNTGLFAKPFPSPNHAPVGSVTDREHAREAAAQSITLLRNENITLPLSYLTVGQVLVTGPAGNSLTLQSGGWSIHWQGAHSDSEFPYGSTLYQGLQSYTRNVNYVQGCDVFSKTNYQQALIEAARADVVIVALAENPESEGTGDINDLSLPTVQLEFVKDLKAVTKGKLIVILYEARPRLITPIWNLTDALLLAYLPGPEGGQPVADILFGRSPSGRLPYTYPAYPGDLGVSYYHKYSDTTSPLFEFGHGLSYTTFQYDNLSVNKIGSYNVRVSFTVRNNGTRVSSHSVLLYLSQMYASVTPEVKLLKKFVRIDNLSPGASASIIFTLAPEDFYFIGIDNRPTLEGGQYSIRAGSLSASFTF